MSAGRGWRSSGVRRERTPLEWALLVSSLAATLAVVAGLVIGGLAGPSAPADLRVTIGESSTVSGGRAAEVVVENVGGESAENVIVEVAAGDVTREVNVPLVAEGDSESSTVVFPPDATGALRASVVSYTNP